MTTASGYDIGTVSTRDLDQFADLVVSQLNQGTIVLALAVPVLHNVALELNRRHRAASEQGRNQLGWAVDFLIAAHAHGDDWSDGQPVPQGHYTQVARAWGVMLDKGTAAAWKALRWNTEFTPETALAHLYELAVQEGRRLSFDRQASRVTEVDTFFPADAVPPF